MTVDGGDHRSFWEVSVLEVYSFHYFDVGALGFCEVGIVCFIEVDGCSKSVGEKGGSIIDHCVGMEEVRW